MLIAVTAEGEGPESRVNTCFSGAPHVLFFAVSDDGHITLREARDARDWGRGAEYAARIARKRPRAVITGELGPGAFRELESGALDIRCGEGLRARQAAEAYLRDELERITTPRPPGNRG